MELTRFFWSKKRLGLISDCFDGFWTFLLNLDSENAPTSQEAGFLLSISLRPMKYQTQAIQWASSAKVDMSSVRTTALYWE